MKKSKIYHLAQLSVLTDTGLSIEDKLEILCELMAKENLEKFSEKKKEERENA